MDNAIVATPATLASWTNTIWEWIVHEPWTASWDEIRVGAKQFWPDSAQSGQNLAKVQPKSSENPVKIRWNCVFLGMQGVPWQVEKAQSVKVLLTIGASTKKIRSTSGRVQWWRNQGEGLRTRGLAKISPRERGRERERKKERQKESGTAERFGWSFWTGHNQIPVLLPSSTELCCRIAQDKTFNRMQMMLMFAGCACGCAVEQAQLSMKHYPYSVVTLPMLHHCVFHKEVHQSDRSVTWRSVLCLPSERSSILRTAPRPGLPAVRWLSVCELTRGRFMHNTDRNAIPTSNNVTLLKRNRIASIAQQLKTSYLEATQEVPFDRTQVH